MDARQRKSHENKIRLLEISRDSYFHLYYSEKEENNRLKKEIGILITRLQALINIRIKEAENANL